MNDFFCTIGDKLAKDTQENCRQENKRQNMSSTEHDTAVPIIEQIKIDKHFLQSQLKSVKPEKATGPDGVRPKDFKLAGDCIVEGLDLVMQKSKETQTMPSKWKVGEVKIAFKKGDTTQRTNYRPLTMLCLSNKILEGQICKQIDNHVETNNLSTNCQWGYKKGISTEILLLKMIEDWKIAIDNGKVVGVIFLDFRKAFDVVSHPVLMEKTEKTGIRGALYNWILDYLTNRCQYTDVNGLKSRIRIVEYGVGQYPKIWIILNEIKFYQKMIPKNPGIAKQ